MNHKDYIMDCVEDIVGQCKYNINNPETRGSPYKSAYDMRDKAKRVLEFLEKMDDKLFEDV